MFAPLVSRFMDMKRKPTEGTLAWSEPPEKEKSTDYWSNRAEAQIAGSCTKNIASILLSYSTSVVWWAY